MKNLLKLALISLAALGLVACGDTGSRAVPSPSPGPLVQPVAEANPVHIESITSEVLVAGPKASDTGHDANGEYLYWPDLKANEDLVRVSVRLVNDSADVVELNDTSLSLTYGPTGLSASSVGAGQLPSKIQPHGTATIQRDFVVPRPDVTGAEVTTGLPETTDPASPYQVGTVQ